jgi:DNA-binding transcriptional regulator GbsR (MarR family)
MNASRKAVVEEFVERMGLVAEGDGLPRIAGRIMGLMVIEGGPLSFAELAQRRTHVS